MQDNELLANVISVLEPWLRKKWPTAEVISNQQPTQQGVPLVPTVTIEILSYKRVGFPRVDYKWKPGPGEDLNLIPYTTIQVMENRMQFSAMALQDPSNLDLPTAGDVAKYAALLLSVDAIIQDLRARGVFVQRSVDVRNPYWSNDRDRFQAHPSFDLILQHHDEILTDVPKINAFEAETYPV